jgi:hypothetical protein
MLLAKWVGNTKWKNKETLEKVVTKGEIVGVHGANKKVFVCRGGKKFRFFLADISDLEFCNDLNEFDIDGE